MSCCAEGPPVNLSFCPGGPTVDLSFCPGGPPEDLSFCPEGSPVDLSFCPEGPPEDCLFVRRQLCNLYIPICISKIRELFGTVWFGVYSNVGIVFAKSIITKGEKQFLSYI